MPNDPLGTPRLITLHWTAGSYTQTHDSYHFCVTGDGRTVQTLGLQFKGSHVWGRNTGNIGIAMCCMANARTLPLARQIEETAALVADLSVQYAIPFGEATSCRRHKVEHGRRVPLDQHVAIARITDHAAYARCDGYYPDRWDCGRYTEEIVRKARWYANEIARDRRRARRWT
jgi:hypothetical protein